MSSGCSGWRTRSRSLGHGDGAGPRQYPSGSGTSGPGRTEWPPGRNQARTGATDRVRPGGRRWKKKGTMGADGPLAPCCWPSRGPAWGVGLWRGGRLPWTGSVAWPCANLGSPAAKLRKAQKTCGPHVTFRHILCRPVWGGGRVYTAGPQHPLGSHSPPTQSIYSKNIKKKAPAASASARITQYSLRVHPPKRCKSVTQKCRLRRGGRRRWWRRRRR